MRRKATDDLLTHLESRLIPIPACGCEVWEGSLNTSGYGIMVIDSIPYVVHKLRWELVKGEIPDGLNTLHKCDLPCCAALEHLEIGTQSKNMQDAVSRGRYKTGERHHVMKLTDVQVQEIRSAPGLQREIAERYGITPQHVSRIKLGQSR